MEALRDADEIRDANTRYHDVAASGYDSKWGIDFGQTGRRQVLGKLRKLVGTELDRGYERSLEIGAGTGYFSLNLLKAGVVKDATCTDISPGMVAVLAENARRLDVEAHATQADSEALPFADESFDLVLGHAVLHHLPDLERSFAEFRRVLRPGGRLAFAGEPSRVGDRLARWPKQAAQRAAPTWRRALGADPMIYPQDTSSADGPVHALEHVVDVHAFTPGELASLVRRAGLTDARIRGEELVANWFGWFNRALEATADPLTVPAAWKRYAYHGYLACQQVDQRLFEPRLPPAIFYNLLLTARRPD